MLPWGGKSPCIHSSPVVSLRLNIDLEGASKIASDRKNWREMICHTREFLGAGYD